MKAEDIRRRLAELALDTNEYRINAGGAMLLHGLREETRDLDILCTKKLGDALLRRGFSYGEIRDALRRYEADLEDLELEETMTEELE